MPLTGSTSDNIREFHKGRTYSATRKKFGKKRADKQAVAVALSKKKRKSTSRKAKGR